MPRRFVLAISFCAGLAALDLGGASRAAEPDAALPAVEFSRDIRPILSRNCWACHGPDDENRQSGLRLDRRDEALAPADSQLPAIVPGHPEQSELVRRIGAADESERMPPPETKKSLAAREIELLTRWIAEGAEYAPHWSLIKPARPELPAVMQTAWPRNEIDRFILARLESEGLAPSPEAARETLIRRVSLDLIGLPPTPAEVDAFVADTGGDAYERLVDRLLASPHYGERWARTWLDVARYADTNGYEKDRPRSIWPYRDWVIAALNRDLPFDQFAIEQIAGDMLPGATPEQIIATGFHRNTMINEEGGIDVEEFRFKSIVDRVQTTATAFLGLTLHCSQCHTHKYDPFTHREYYALFAMLNNADEVDFPVPDAAIAAQREEVTTKIAGLEAERASILTQKLGGDERTVESRLDAWIAENRPRAGRWTPLRPSSAKSLKRATLTTQPDGSVLVHGDWPNNDTYELEFEVPESPLTAVRLEVLPDESLPDGGPGRAPLFSVGDFLLSEIEMSVAPSDGGAATPVALAGASHDFASDKRSAALCFDGLLDTGWSIAGGIGRAHRAVFTPREPIAIAPGSKLRVSLVQQYIHQMTIGRFRIWVTSDAAPAAASELPCDVERSLSHEAPSDEDRRLLREYFLGVAPELSEHNTTITELRKSLPRFTTTMIMQERAAETARVTHRHHRGEFLDPREAVEPGVPEALHQLPPGMKPDRLALARWLVSEDSPLIGRVTMNRAWAAIFGRGLVPTVEDFGATGERPSHPELLDWLATELVRRGWSMKAMHRLLVTSATYRQSSRITPELAARDPANALLARGPRQRLDAETIRDAALSAAGLLDRRIGGPSVFPPQPAGVSELSYGAAAWKTSEGGDRFRRGLYTYLKRTSPYPGLIAFDAPTADVTCPRRLRSNTPLQALVLLNDAVFTEAAQGLARQIVAEAGDAPSNRVRLAFRLCLSREPSSDEELSVLSFYKEQRDRLAAGELDAKAIMSSKALPLPEGADAIELAAWTTVARAMLNLDETITKD